MVSRQKDESLIPGIEQGNSVEVNINQEEKSRLKRRMPGNLHAKILSKNCGEKIKIAG
jgi:hypothetical protein